MKYKINFFFSIGQLKFIKRKKKEEQLKYMRKIQKVPIKFTI